MTANEEKLLKKKLANPMSFGKTLAVIVLAVGAIVGSTFYIRNEIIEQSRPKNAYCSQPDLNHDGIRDMMIELQEGHKIPLYGIETSGVIYVSADEMMRRNPNSIIDYETIEEQLNE